MLRCLKSADTNFNLNSTLYHTTKRNKINTLKTHIDYVFQLQCKTIQKKKNNE